MVLAAALRQRVVDPVQETVDPVPGDGRDEQGVATGRQLDALIGIDQIGLVEHQQARDVPVTQIAEDALDRVDSGLVSVVRPVYEVDHQLGVFDFLERGAAGVINAAGINCMVGTSISGAVPAIRADYDQAPVVNLLYGCSEGPSQRILLETFVHQVKQRWQRERGRLALGT